MHETGQRFLKASVLSLTSLWSASDALACPLCHSDTGALVRAGIFNENFWTNAFTTALPFPVFGIIAALIHFYWPNPRRSEPPQEITPDGIPTS